MKKYFLKGKQFLSKKLEQLQLDIQSNDIVTEQLPNRLKSPLKVLQSNIDLEDSEKYDLYFKMYPNHHLSEFLLEKYKLLTNANTPTPEVILPKPPIQGIDEIFIPKYDTELENKALILKQVVEEYEEGYYKSNEAVLCVSVIHFHHKRGAQVEYMYPKNKSTQAIQNLIVHHSMPDSSHNKNQDFNYFNFETVVKGKKRMLFGVSYFKQIKVTQAHKQKNEELTRSYMQKAICIVSYLPLFGYLKMRLSQTTKLFFKQFDKFTLIDHAYKDIQNHLVESWPRMSMNELYIGTDLKTVIKLFGAREFYDIWKAVLYQKRIVVFAHSSSSASQFIMSLLSLFPGMNTFGIYSKEISKYMQGLREYGLPLKMFSKQNFMSMSFHIQDFHLLAPFQKSNKGSFLVGTTNRLLKQHNNYGVQLLINLENCTLQKQKSGYFQSISKKQKAFVDELQQQMKKGSAMNPILDNMEDSIRNLFHKFLKSSLIDMMQAVNSFKEFIQKCKQYEANIQLEASKAPRKRSSKSNEQNGIELNEQEEDGEFSAATNQVANFEKNIPIIPQQVTSIPFAQLLLLPSFQFFLQFHNQNLPNLIKRRLSHGLHIENYTYYLKIDSERFVSYDWSTKKLSFGKGNPINFQGKQLKFIKNYQESINSKTVIKDQEVKHVKSVFLGIVEKGKYSKNGFLADKTEIFQGEFYHGMKQGYGKLTNTIHKYIGNFEQDLYSGQGQLVTPKQIYVGQFKQGLRHGCGKNQSRFKDGLNYDGQWVNDRPQGSGIMKSQNLTEFIGFFKAGRIDQSMEVSLRYEDGSVYKGMIKDQQPHGRGFMMDSTGKLQQGLFQNGKFVEQIKINIQNDFSKDKQLQEQQKQAQQDQNQKWDKEKEQKKDEKKEAATEQANIQKQQQKIQQKQQQISNIVKSLQKIDKVQQKVKKQKEQKQ